MLFEPFELFELSKSAFSLEGEEQARSLNLFKFYMSSSENLNAGRSSETDVSKFQHDQDGH